APPMPFAAAVASLGKPGGDAAEQHAHQQHDIKDNEKRHTIAGCSSIDRGHEGIDIDRDELAIGKRKGDEQRAKRHQNQPADDFVDHAYSSGALAPLTFSPAQEEDLFSRSRISLPALNCGTYFSPTSTCSPVRGLRPTRAGRFLTEKAPKPRNSTRSPRAMASPISSRIALTMFSMSRWNRCGFSAASFSTSSDLIIKGSGHSPCHQLGQRSQPAKARTNRQAEQGLGFEKA